MSNQMSGGRGLQRDAGRGFSGRGSRSPRSSDLTPKYSAIKMIDHDPGEGKPVFWGGAASSWVVAKPYMISRAKKAGIWNY
jgi:hypothetical protein